MRAAALLLIVFAAGCGAKISGPAPATPGQFAQMDLAARVKTALLNDATIGQRKIDVSAINGEVTLTGQVVSAAERDRAVNIAKSVQGVRGVTDRLEIRP